MLETGRDFLLDEALTSAGTLVQKGQPHISASTSFFQSDILCYTLILILFFQVLIFRCGFLILRNKT